MSEKKLNILFIEDSKLDTELMLSRFFKAGYDVKSRRVETCAEFLDALAATSWDVIISDFSLPVFNGMVALGLYREFELGIPFIIVSGTIGEDAAAKVMKNGASDYLMKDNLTRLVSVVERAIKEGEDKKLKQKMERELFESERKFRFMTESLPQIIWTTDAQGHMDYINQHWFEFTGLDAKDPAGLNWERALHPDDRNEFLEKWRQAAAAGVDFEVECRFRRAADGSYRWHLGRARLLKDDRGRNVIWLGSFTDIDDQKRAEQATEESNAELRRLNQIRSEFTSMVSHELRTPLTAIKESIAIILDGVDGPITEEQSETLSLAKNNVDRLSRLISNVLNFARLESGKLELHLDETDLKALIAEVCALMKISAVKKALALSCRLPDHAVEVVCDPDNMMQVLINLIDNAIKYTPRGGRIGVELAERNSHVEIRVRDSGIGIPKEDQKRIFDLFAQSFHRGLWHAGGAGVGLAICKRLVEQHDGRISVESRPGEGSTFTVVLPKVPATKGRELRTAKTQSESLTS